MKAVRPVKGDERHMGVTSCHIRNPERQSRSHMQALEPKRPEYESWFCSDILAV